MNGSEYSLYATYTLPTSLLPIISKSILKYSLIPTPRTLRVLSDLLVPILER